uniref:Uncharacterized protein n=1 Tax=Pongo abelii TaxID=9601 RepID=H2NII2_PONAB
MDFESRVHQAETLGFITGEELGQLLDTADDAMGFRDLKSPASLQVLSDYLADKSYIKGMCHHKHMCQYMKQCPAHRLLTCVMPYVGIIRSSLMKRKRPACQQ